jgi:hypothetical protein
LGTAFEELLVALDDLIRCAGALDDDALECALAPFAVEEVAAIFGGQRVFVVGDGAGG